MKKVKNQLEWLLLVHQLPPNPTNLRVRIWRKLQTLGAVPIKNSVYVLPFNEKTNEDFGWLKQEIETSGGEVSLFRADSVEGTNDEEIIALFQEQRNQDYEKLTTGFDDLTNSIREQSKNNNLPVVRFTQLETELGKLHQEFERVFAIDFFQTANQKKAQAAYSKCLRQLQLVKDKNSQTAEKESFQTPLKIAEYQNRRWVTRKNPHIDRLASGWLIKRFIDQRPRFGFINEGERTENSLSFDLVGANFTHQGEDCTFETLVKSFGLENDSALRQIAEIVHDVDLKDNKFNRSEASGVNAVIRGMAEVFRDDNERLKQSFPLFDGLYELFKSTDSNR